MKQIEMKYFLEKKGISVERIEGSDFSSVFHVSESDRNKIKENQSEYEKETGLSILTSDSFGMSVVVIENDEEDEF